MPKQKQKHTHTILAAVKPHNIKLMATQPTKQEKIPKKKQQNSTKKNNNNIHEHGKTYRMKKKLLTNVQMFISAECDEKKSKSRTAAGNGT